MDIRKIEEVEQGDEKLQELSRRRDQLREEGQAGVERLEDLSRQLLDAGPDDREAILEARAAIESRMAALPGQIREVTRRLALRHLEVLKAEREKLREAETDLDRRVTNARRKFRQLKEMHPNEIHSEFDSKLEHSEAFQKQAEISQAGIVKLRKLATARRALGIRARHLYDVALDANQELWNRAANLAARDAGQKIEQSLAAVAA